MRLLLTPSFFALGVALAAAGLGDVAYFATGMTHCCLKTTISGQVLRAVAMVTFQTECMFSITHLRMQGHDTCSSHPVALLLSSLQFFCVLLCELRGLT